MRKQSNNDSKGIHAICPTRWTVRGEALESILNNYDELTNLWNLSIDTLHDTEMKARIRGVQANMPTFDFVYGCSFGILLLKETDNLTRALRDCKMSAAVGNAIARDVIKTLSKDRNDSADELFWECVLKRKEELNVQDPKLPRQKKLPRKLDECRNLPFPINSERSLSPDLFSSTWRSNQLYQGEIWLARFPKIRPSAGNVPESNQGSAVWEWGKRGLLHLQWWYR